MASYADSSKELVILEQRRQGGLLSRGFQLDNCKEKVKSCTRLLGPESASTASAPRARVSPRSSSSGDVYGLSSVPYQRHSSLLGARFFFLITLL